LARLQVVFGGEMSIKILMITLAVGYFIGFVSASLYYILGCGNRLGRWDEN